MKLMNLKIFLLLFFIALAGCAFTVSSSKTETKPIVQVAPATQAKTTAPQQQTKQQPIQTQEKTAQAKAEEVKPVLKDIVKIRIERHYFFYSKGLETEANPFLKAVSHPLVYIA